MMGSSVDVDPKEVARARESFRHGRTDGPVFKLDPDKMQDKSLPQCIYMLISKVNDIANVVNEMYHKDTP